MTFCLIYNKYQNESKRQYRASYLDQPVQRHAVELTPGAVKIVSRFSLLLTLVVVNELIINDRCTIGQAIRVAAVHVFNRG